MCEIEMQSCPFYFAEHVAETLVTDCSKKIEGRAVEPRFRSGDRSLCSDRGASLEEQGRAAASQIANLKWQKLRSEI
jgi:hypothetical protein